MLAALIKGGLAGATRSLAVWVCLRRHLGQRIASGVIQTTVHPANSYRRPSSRVPSLGRAGQVSDVVDGVLLLESSL